MTAAFRRRAACNRFGLKGPRAAEWLGTLGLAVPRAPNSWCAAPAWAGGGPSGGVAGAVLVARLGAGEFFVEEPEGGTALGEAASAAELAPPGVYPVLREDAAFVLEGGATAAVLAQVCNLNFADLDLSTQPIVMTLMIGVAVLVLPRPAASGAGRDYFIWCDPTFGEYLEASVGAVVIDCGGSYERESA
jgi:sarcosine oxidase subunit gamma